MEDWLKMDLPCLPTCEWDVTELYWLEYYLTPKGLKPRKNKIGNITTMHCPEPIK